VEFPAIMHGLRQPISGLLKWASTTIGAKHALIGFLDSQETRSVFDLREGPPDTLQAACRLSRGTAF
jgi:hypothetical protein